MTRLKKPEAPHIRGTCVVCNIRQQKMTGYKDKEGRRKYKPLCIGCENVKYYGKTAPFTGHGGVFKYRKHKDTVCVKCNFEAIHPCQLDVDHIDGDHSNNAVDNLQTLCANCHRLKTQTQRWGQDFSQPHR